MVSLLTLTFVYEKQTNIQSILKLCHQISSIDLVLQWNPVANLINLFNLKLPLENGLKIFVKILKMMLECTQLKLSPTITLTSNLSFARLAEVLYQVEGGKKGCGYFLTY